MNVRLTYLLLLTGFLACDTNKSETQATTEESTQEEVIKSPSDFFPRNKAKVLVVGTFHFDYPGLDIHTINEFDRIDVLDDGRQEEVTELAEYIKQFNPNKIAIEAFHSWEATKKLRDYKRGKIQLGRGERYQLGIRIASELGLDTLYSIDADNLYMDLEKTNKEFIDALTYGFDSVDVDSIIEQHFENWRVYNDEVLKDVTLLESFKYLNSREYHQLDYGTYLIGFFKLDQQRGADILSIWWYNRNLRIFRSIQEITEKENDRILVIFGNGHAALLRQFLECSAEYEYVEFNDL